jgi:hypothetical protein
MGRLAERARARATPSANASQFELPLHPPVAQRQDSTPSPEVAKELGRLHARVAELSSGSFPTHARQYVIRYLEQHGQCSTELLTDACKLAGIRPPAPKDDRAFGGVYLSLLNDRTITKVGTCPRSKGHGTGGGNVVALTSALAARREASEAAA